MELAVQIFGYLSAATLILMSIVGLNGHRDLAYWLGVGGLICATLATACWLQGYWWRIDASADDRPAVKYIAKTYSALFNASHWLVDEEHFDKENPPDRVFVMKLSFIERADFELQQLETFLASSRPNTDAVQSMVPEFVDHSKVLLKKLKYFSNMYSPERRNAYFVGNTPIDELAAITDLLVRVRKEYPDIFSDGDIVFNGVLEVEELEGIWSRLPGDRVCLHPREFSFEQAKGKKLFVYGPSVMKKLTGLDDGTIVEVWGNYL